MKAKIRKKLKALNEVFGMLKELTSEQLEIFEAEVKRKPFWRNK